MLTVARAYWHLHDLMVVPLESLGGGVTLRAPAKGIVLDSPHIRSGRGNGIEIHPGVEGVFIREAHLHHLGIQEGGGSRNPRQEGGGGRRAKGARVDPATTPPGAGIRIFPGTRDIKVIESEIRNIWGYPLDVVEPKDFDPRFHQRCELEIDTPGSSRRPRRSGGSRGAGQGSFDPGVRVHCAVNLDRATSTLGVGSSRASRASAGGGVMGSAKRRSALAVFTFCLAFSAIALAQVSEDTGERDNFVLAPDGTLLVVTSPSDDNSGLVRRSALGVDSTIVAPGASLSLGTIHGIGSNPHMNASGVAASKSSSPALRSNTAIYTGVPGDIDLIADTGDVIDGDADLLDRALSADQRVEPGLLRHQCPERRRLRRGRGTQGGLPLHAALDHVKLLVADTDGSGNEVTTSDPDFVTSQTTFDVVDAHIISFGGDVAGSNGAIMAMATLRPSTSVSTCITYETPPCERALLYLGPNAGTVTLIALEGADSVFDGAKLKGVANNVGSGAVQGAGHDLVGNAGAASVRVLDFGRRRRDGRERGSGIPGAASGTFNGFTPHLDINDNGNAAFTAGLNLGSRGRRCIAGDICRGVYYKPSGGAIVEIAPQHGRCRAGSWRRPRLHRRIRLRRDRLGGGGRLLRHGVFRRREQRHANQACGAGGVTEGDGEYTGIFAWNNGTLMKVVQEGDALDGRVMRLFTAMPELRQNASEGQFAVRAWLDANADCIADTEVTLVADLGLVGCGVGPTPTPTNTLVPGQPTNTPTITPTRTPTRIPDPNASGSVAPAIPALGPVGDLVLRGPAGAGGRVYALASRELIADPGSPPLPLYSASEPSSAAAHFWILPLAGPSRTPVSIRRFVTLAMQRGMSSARSVEARWKLVGKACTCRPRRWAHRCRSRGS